MSLQIISAYGLGDEIILEFNQDVYSSSTVLPGFYYIFSVQINGQDIDGLWVNGGGASSWEPDKLTLSLTQPIHHSDQITLSYAASSDPSITNIESLQGDHLLDFNNLSVANNTSDRASPIAQEAIAYGRFIEIYTNEALYYPSTINSASEYQDLFEVTSDGDPLEIESIETSFWSTNVIGIWLKQSIPQGAVIHITLRNDQPEKRDDVIQDLFGNDLTSFNNLQAEVQENDSEAPELVNIFTDSNGNLELIFNEDVVNQGFINGPSPTDFTVHLDSIQHTFSGLSWSPEEPNIKTLHSSNSGQIAEPDEIISLSYEQGVTGSLMDKYGNQMESFNEEFRVSTRFQGQITEEPRLHSEELLAPITVNTLTYRNAFLGSATHDRIKGTSSDEIIYGGGSRDIIQGNGGNDAFAYKSLSEFGRKTFDIILDFNRSDTIIIYKNLISNALYLDITYTSTRREITKASRSSNAFIYHSTSGHLFFNENGSQSGFGEGGLFVQLVGAPQLLNSSIHYAD